MQKSNNRTVLFVCTHNSARSQMAEGFLNSLCGDDCKAYSAGTEHTIVHPIAVQVMSEIGIDISKHRSKSLNEFREKKFDYVITVCDHAKETCPFFPGGLNRSHQNFEDPASFKGNEADKLSEFRRILDEIMDWITEYFSN
ncbi:arsenate reductase ArsC [Acidobacteriota bacterium]